MITIAHISCSIFFFFNDTATTEIYTLSLHDALPICSTGAERTRSSQGRPLLGRRRPCRQAHRDRKSTRLNSSHLVISYAVFCLKKKKKNIKSVCLIIKVYTSIICTISGVSYVVNIHA